MSTVNKMILLGNLGVDPEVRTTQAGKQVAELRVATSYGTGDNVTTEWHRVVLWDKLADVASKFLRKGSKVYIEGRVQTRSYDDKDGNKRYITEIVASEMRLMSPKAETASGDETAESEGLKEPVEPAKRRGRKPRWLGDLTVEDLEF